MNGKANSWESEFWLCLSQGDGVKCPIYESCVERLAGCCCLSDHEEYCRLLTKHVDVEFLNSAEQAIITSEFPRCIRTAKIFEFVHRLAQKYQVKAGINCIPVPADLITRADDGHSIEIGYVPLQAHHGAVWQMNDRWLVQLNSNDTPARQKFTLYHEIFHIQAHCNATPMSGKTSRIIEGLFNEFLADHFAAVILLPGNQVSEWWFKVKDIKKMAAIFEVPKTIMLCSLIHLGLI